MPTPLPSLQGCFYLSKHWVNARQAVRAVTSDLVILDRGLPDALAPVATYGLPKETRPLIETSNTLLECVQQAIIREQRFTNHASADCNQNPPANGSQGRKSGCNNIAQLCSRVRCAVELNP